MPGGEGGEGTALSCIAFTDIANASTTAVLFRLIELRTHFVPKRRGIYNYYVHER